MALRLDLILGLGNFSKKPVGRSNQNLSKPFVDSIFAYCYGFQVVCFAWLVVLSFWVFRTHNLTKVSFSIGSASIATAANAESLQLIQTGRLLEAAIASASAVSIHLKIKKIPRDDDLDSHDHLDVCFENLLKSLDGINGSQLSESPELKRQLYLVMQSNDLGENKYERLNNAIAKCRKRTNQANAMR